MRSCNLHVCMILNCLSYGMVLCSWCYFVRIQSGNPISRKFNWCVTDGPTNGRTDTPSYRDARTHLKNPHDHLNERSVVGMQTCFWKIVKSSRLSLNKIKIKDFLHYRTNAGMLMTNACISNHLITHSFVISFQHPRRWIHEFECRVFKLAFGWYI